MSRGKRFSAEHKIDVVSDIVLGGQLKGAKSLSSLDEPGAAGVAREALEKKS